METLLDHFSEPELAALIGVLTGVIFGFAAQRSRFCLRAAAVEFARGDLGEKVAIWLLTFSTAVVWVQGAAMAGLFRASDARMMAVAGSWSGAIVGGLMFGVGMVLARGCSGRLLVLGATGNLRSIISGLLFAVVAQMSLHGWLAPAREAIAALWTTSGGRNIDAAEVLGLTQGMVVVLALMLAVLAIGLAIRARLGVARLVFASGVGFSIALGWVLTWRLAAIAFDPVSVTSATFSGPSANTLMYFLTGAQALSFDVGLVPGVVVGAFAGGVWGRELRLEGFEGAGPMRRAMIGAALMGFGAMLAGGCAIGAGVTGGSLLVATALVALFFMWVGAGLTDWLVDRPGHAALAA